MTAACRSRVTRAPPCAATLARVPSAPAELPFLQALRRIADAGAGRVELHTLCEVDDGRQRHPVLALTLGSAAPDAPALGLFGGVHGLERIGAEVALACLQSLVMRLRWDVGLQRLLGTLRVVAVPLVNPGGLARGTRANPNGVDLMRNAPIEATDHVPFLIGGQRISAALPWYRGPAGAPMEAESAALCALVERELLTRPFSIAVDCHSGFGTRDRVWFPYAHTLRPVAQLAELAAFKRIFDESLPHHRYVLEPQSHQYLTHGDLWDHLVLRAQARADAPTFLPLTLEMGSWLWVKKNPRQLFTRHGIFNPLIEHRQQRVLRRHVAWLDFVMRAAASHAQWVPADTAARAALHEEALGLWYRGEARRG